MAKPEYFIDASQSPSDALAKQAELVYELACRRDFSAPGFALVRLSYGESSLSLRLKLIELKELLSQILKRDCHKSLGWFNMTRFDQKESTRLHRDGAPAESLLLLGYEPTQIRSSLSIADYSKCAHEMGYTPEEFLEKINPMYEQGLEQLKPYITMIEAFEPGSSQLLIINNSSLPLLPGKKNWLGVLHGARVAEGNSPRIINSTCVAPREKHTDHLLSSEEEAGFLCADIAGANYS